MSGENYVVAIHKNNSIMLERIVMGIKTYNSRSSKMEPKELDSTRMPITTIWMYRTQKELNLFILNIGDGNGS